MNSVQKKSIKDYLYCDKAKQFVFVYFLSVIFVYAFMYRILDSRQVFYFVVPVFIYWICDRKETPFDLQFLFLYAAYFFMGIYEHMTEPWMNYQYNVMVYSYIMPVTYLLGKMCVGEDRNHADKRALVVLNVVNAGMFLLAVIDYIKKYVENSFNDYRYVGWNAFWNNEYVVKNEVDFGFYMMIGALFFAYLNRKTLKKFWIIVVISELFIIVNSIIVRGRSNILYMIVLVMLSYLIYLLSDSIDEKQKIIWLRVIILILIMAMVPIVLIKYNCFGLGDIYENSFLNRDGGIIHNVRFTWNLEGLRKIFTLQKGGWIVESNTFKYKTHSTWLEYGRNYDIYIYTFLLLFIIYSLLDGVRALLNYNKTCKVLYYSFGAQILYCIYFCMEPMGYNYRDWIIVFFFLCGITSGLKNSITTRPVRNIKFIDCSKYYFSDLGIIFLFLALLSRCYIDWWRDENSVMRMFAIPMVLYMLAILIRNKKSIYSLLIITSIGGILCAIRADSYSEIFVYGIVPTALIIAFICKKISANKYVIVLITGCVFVALFISKINDGRLAIIKEAINLTFRYEFGSPWRVVVLDNNVFSTSSNFWLNYSRDYGVVVFSLMCLFSAWIMLQWCRLLRNNDDRELIDYALLISILLFFGYFFIYDTGYEKKILFYIYIVLSGLLVNRNNNSLVTKRMTNEDKYNDLL
ncbi:MAG: hypothetical protein IJJ59_12105 [Pseudobutyrivibrio sp.]|uniref:hypothetical protein n=1 Tax=Pseudobutyrivibrio sp. TaxID=2014367 RepID=UPI0025F98F60|nr:hypothetical protein [Pseudobutyrivibrio sp.]MBQ6464057.1 hypothetical protein [Pseudobutyrivibrio sp.]